MSVFEAIILGVIQGLTEFLPVSSSGHLVLLQRIFDIQEPALLFDTMVHVGTLGAIFIVLWKDILDILRRIVQPLTGYLILGTIPAVIGALLFKDALELTFQSGAYLGFAFLFTALVLFLIEGFSGGRSREAFFAAPQSRARPSLGNALSWLDALIIGLCQAVAIIPGVSRSGLTLSGALSRRLDRDYAARFSFLLSIPAILGALVLQLKDLFMGPGLEGGASIGAIPILAGTLSAGAVGFFAVKFMLALVRKRRLWGFAVYTALLGVLTLIDQNLSHIFFQ